jgi:hypothetical protein
MPHRSAIRSVTGNIRPSNHGRKVFSTHCCSCWRRLLSGRIVTVKISPSDTTLKKSWVSSHRRAISRLADPIVGVLVRRERWYPAGNRSSFDGTASILIPFKLEVQTFERRFLQIIGSGAPAPRPDIPRGTSREHALEPRDPLRHPASVPASRS